VSNTSSATPCKTIHRAFRVPSAVNELEDGAIQSFALFENGTLSDALSSTNAGGGAPAHVFSSPSGVVSAMSVSHLKFDTVIHDLIDHLWISTLEEVASLRAWKTMGQILETRSSSPSHLSAPVVSHTRTKLSSLGTSCSFQTS